MSSTSKDSAQKKDTANQNVIEFGLYSKILPTGNYELTLKQSTFETLGNDYYEIPLTVMVKKLNGPDEPSADQADNQLNDVEWDQHCDESCIEKPCRDRTDGGCKHDLCDSMVKGTAKVIEKRSSRLLRPMLRQNQLPSYIAPSEASALQRYYSGKSQGQTSYAPHPPRHSTPPSNYRQQSKYQHPNQPYHGPQHASPHHPHPHSYPSQYHSQSYHPTQMHPGQGPYYDYAQPTYKRPSSYANRPSAVPVGRSRLSTACADDERIPCAEAELCDLDRCEQNELCGVPPPQPPAQDKADERVVCNETDACDPELCEQDLVCGIPLEPAPPAVNQQNQCTQLGSSQRSRSLSPQRTSYPPPRQQSMRGTGQFSGDCEQPNGYSRRSSAYSGRPSRFSAPQPAYNMSPETYNRSYSMTRQSQVAQCKREPEIVPCDVNTCKHLKACDFPQRQPSVRREPCGPPPQMDNYVRCSQTNLCDPQRCARDEICGIPTQNAPCKSYCLEEKPSRNVRIQTDGPSHFEKVCRNTPARMKARAEECPHNQQSAAQSARSSARSNHPTIKSAEFDDEPTGFVGFVSYGGEGGFEYNDEYEVIEQNYDIDDMYPHHTGGEDSIYMQQQGEDIGTQTYPDRQPCKKRPPPTPAVCEYYEPPLPIPCKCKAPLICPVCPCGNEPIGEPSAEPCLEPEPPKTYCIQIQSAAMPADGTPCTLPNMGTLCCIKVQSTKYGTNDGPQPLATCDSPPPPEPNNGTCVSVQRDPQNAGIVCCIEPQPNANSACSNGLTMNTDAVRVCCTVPQDQTHLLAIQPVNNQSPNQNVCCIHPQGHQNIAPELGNRCCVHPMGHNNMAQATGQRCCIHPQGHQNIAPELGNGCCVHPMGHNNMAQATGQQCCIHPQGHQNIAPGLGNRCCVHPQGHDNMTPIPGQQCCIHPQGHRNLSPELGNRCCIHPQGHGPTQSQMATSIATQDPQCSVQPIDVDNPLLETINICCKYPDGETNLQLSSLKTTEKQPMEEPSCPLPQKQQCFQIIPMNQNGQCPGQQQQQPQICCICVQGNDQEPPPPPPPPQPQCFRICPIDRNNCQSPEPQGGHICCICPQSSDGCPMQPQCYHVTPIDQPSSQNPTQLCCCVQPQGNQNCQSIEPPICCCMHQQNQPSHIPTVYFNTTNLEDEIKTKRDSCSKPFPSSYQDQPITQPIIEYPYEQSDYAGCKPQVPKTIPYVRCSEAESCDTIRCMQGRACGIPHRPWKKDGKKCTCCQKQTCVTNPDYRLSANENNACDVCTCNAQAEGKIPTINTNQQQVLKITSHEFQFDGGNSPVSAVCSAVATYVQNNNVNQVESTYSAPGYRPHKTHKDIHMPTICDINAENTPCPGYPGGPTSGSQNGAQNGPQSNIQFNLPNADQYPRMSAIDYAKRRVMESAGFQPSNLSGAPVELIHGPAKISGAPGPMQTCPVCNGAYARSTSNEPQCPPPIRTVAEYQFKVDKPRPCCCGIKPQYKNNSDPLQMVVDMYEEKMAPLKKIFEEIKQQVREINFPETSTCNCGKQSKRAKRKSELYKAGQFNFTECPLMSGLLPNLKGYEGRVNVVVTKQDWKYTTDNLKELNLIKDDRSKSIDRQKKATSSEMKETLLGTHKVKSSSKSNNASKISFRTGSRSKSLINSKSKSKSNSNTGKSKSNSLTGKNNSKGSTGSALPDNDDLDNDENDPDNDETDMDDENNDDDEFGANSEPELGVENHDASIESFNFDGGNFVMEATTEKMKSISRAAKTSSQPSITSTELIIKKKPFSRETQHTLSMPSVYRPQPSDTNLYILASKAFYKGYQGHYFSLDKELTKEGARMAKAIIGFERGMQEFAPMELHAAAEPLEISSPTRRAISVDPEDSWVQRLYK